MSDHQVGEDSGGVWMCDPECPFDDMHDCPKWEACHKYYLSLPIEMVPEGHEWIAATLAAIERIGK